MINPCKLSAYRSRSTHGRLVPKPAKPFDINTLDYLEEQAPIQEQIESLRAKISLKEKYNRVLREEWDESAYGANKYIEDLYLANKELRDRLMQALQNEKDAVQQALRTHRLFQLAMTDKTPLFAIPWLEDKTYDLGKRMNELLYRLHAKRGKMAEAEMAVQMMERWPRPGTLPWEMEALDDFDHLESAIDEYKVKFESASIINAKYRAICHLLKEESGKYEPILRDLYSQMESQGEEIKDFRQMLKDAQNFKNDASRNLRETEEEAIWNRKNRKKQLSKMKRAVHEVLGVQQAKAQVVQEHQRSAIHFKKNLEEMGRLYEMKREQVADIAEKASLVVHEMHVQDLTHIPERMQILTDMECELKDEINCKDMMRNMLIKHRDALQLTECYLKYTGSVEADKFALKKQEGEEEIEKIRGEKEEISKNIQKYGSIIVDVRLCILAILQTLEFGKSHPEAINILGPNVKVEMGILCHNASGLIQEVKELEGLFDGAEEARRDYGALVKQPTIPLRYVRVKTEGSDSDDDERDLSDSLKVPTREEIKERSQRFITHAKLKRGIQKSPLDN